MSRRQAATGLAAGLALIVAAPLVWLATQPDPAGQTVSSVNAAAAAALASPTPVTSGAPGTGGPSTGPSAETAADRTVTNADPPTSSGSGTAAATPVPTPVQSPAGTPEPAPEPPPAPAPAAAPVAGPPARIELPALGVDTVIVPVGVDSSGEMEVPQDVSTVGWYRFGPAPGSAAGSAVLSGHVDDYRQGVGVFARIGELGPGDLVRVVDDAGVSREFSVLSREEWSKGDVPLDRLFDRGGSSRLVLITCGGSFNNSTLGYDDNIAITAVPISAPPITS